MGDAHVRIVDRVGEQKGGRAVRTPNDEVLEVVRFEAHVAADDIVEDDTLTFLHPIANGEAVA